MAKDIPLKIEVLSSADDDQYRVITPREIVFIIQSIIKSRSRVALYYSEDNDFILTTLLDVNISGIWLETSMLPEENAHILDSEKLVIVSSQGQVKIQFVASHAKSIRLEGQPAIFLPLPKSIYRIQRREYFRLSTPVVNPLTCFIPETNTKEQDLPHEMTIMDISGGGVGLTCTEQDTTLTPGETYENCKIHLPEVGDLVGTIQVKNLIVLSTAAGKVMRRAGCKFKDLDGASTILLQRYVTSMQRTRR
ncbi:MAG: flagellar brake protein [Gallionella sp.]